MTTTKTSPTETVREIAALQQQLADLLDETGRRAEVLNIAITRKADELIAGLAADRRSAAEAAATIAAERVNTGELSSRVCDAFERRVHAVYPMPYQPIAAKWAMIENRR